ncbi:MAG: spore photoproduct lyase family protein [bacterium]
MTEKIKKVIHKGEFLKPCQGKGNYICCGYFILSTGFNCNIGCSYCILQSYFETPGPVVFSNTDDLFAELDDKLKRNPQIIRVGTGELMDSLLFDNVMNYNRRLIHYFSCQNQAFLELKTKTDNIKPILELETNSRIVMAWSLNPQKVIISEEGKSVSLERRLTAAGVCSNAGYYIAFHFDPIIYYQGWERDYFNIVDHIAKNIHPDKIIMISLGTLRYNTEVKIKALQNHPRTKIFYGEFVKSPDGKMRYFKPIRLEIYSTILEYIRKRLGNVFVYMCMETADVWNKVMKEPDITTDKLKIMLDMHYKQFH